MQAHEWRVLLPDGPKYRFRSGGLRPVVVRNPMARVQRAPGVLTDRVNVGGNEEDVITVTAESPLLDERRISTGATVTQAELEKIPTSRDPWKVLAHGLQQGLVGGVKPLPITIPEAGKVLFLTGVLPPAKVGVEIEVKAKG